MATTTAASPDTLKLVDQAVKDGKLSAAAAANIRIWLTEPRYAEYAAEVAEHVAAGKWKELDDVFWTVIPFGTGGRRGKMYPIGSNAINDRTIGESAQGLADYVKDTLGPGAKLSLRDRLRHAASLASTSPSCAPRSWRPPASRSTSSTAIAARRSCRSPCATRSARAASWSRPATTRRATTP